MPNVYKNWIDEFHSDDPPRHSLPGHGTAESARNFEDGDFGEGMRRFGGRCARQAVDLELPAVLIGLCYLRAARREGELKAHGRSWPTFFSGRSIRGRSGLTKLNPDMKLPELPIQVLHRSEQGSTTFFRLLPK